MDEWTPGPAEDVEELEFRIDELRDSIARSRRLMAAGRAAVGVGAVLLLALMIGVFAFAPARVVFALALMIGGVVLAGSSKSSTEQLERSLERAERAAQRGDRRARPHRGGRAGGGAMRPA